MLVIDHSREGVSEQNAMIALQDFFSLLCHLQMQEKLTNASTTLSSCQTTCCAAILNIHFTCRSRLDLKHEMTETQWPQAGDKKSLTMSTGRHAARQWTMTLSLKLLWLDSWTCSSLQAGTCNLHWQNDMKCGWKRHPTIESVILTDLMDKLCSCSVGSLIHSSYWLASVALHCAAATAPAVVCY